MKRLISALTLASLLILPVQAAYDDVPYSHSYIKGITYVELQGASDDAESFRPDEIITRAEAYKLLFEVLGIEEVSATGNVFDDAPIDAWFSPYAEMAVDHGLISDRTPEFNPSKQIRRLDAIRLIMQAYGLNTPVIPDDAEDIYNDVKVGSAAHPWVYQMVQLDIVTPQNDTFQTYLPITRGEYAQWLYQFDQWMQIFELNQYAQSNTDFYKSDIMAAIWDRIESDYYLSEGQYIDQDALFQAAVKGMVESLNDPYSKYFTEEEANSFTQSISGEFEGIGAILNQTQEGQIQISGLIEGGPAAEAGLKKNDIILEVDSIDISEMSMEAVIERIKGPEGTDVTLKIDRGGDTLFITITRAHIEVVLQSGQVKWGDTWYIDLDSFTMDMPGKLMNIIFELEEQVEEPDAIVLDLRGNPGGSLQSATFTCGLFVPQLTPLVQLDYSGFVEVIYNGDTGPYKEYPIIILVDGNSASASEIVASTLQEQGATVIGSQTFGKGTAQTYTTYWDGSALKLTIAEWLSGEGQSIQGIGVTPDVVLPDDADDAAYWEAVKKRL
jgi:carboxyl-terminal processing protease